MSGSADAVADQGDRLGDLAHRDEADVGPAEPGIGDGGARDVERLEAGFCRERGGERIVDAGRDDDAGARDSRSFRLTSTSHPEIGLLQRGVLAQLRGSAGEREDAIVSSM